MIKAFRHCKIWGTKRVKRKPSFGKLGAGLQMFFQVGVLKNVAILELFLNKFIGLLLQNTDGSCFWIFAAANIFFS